MEPFRVTLRRAKATKNTICFEEAESGEPPVIGTLYIQNWALHRLGEPNAVVVTVEALPAAGGEAGNDQQPD